MEFKIAEIAKLCDFNISLIIYNRESKKYYIFKSNDLWRPNIKNIVSFYNSYIILLFLIIISLYILNLRISFLEISRSLIKRRKKKNQRKQKNVY